MILEITEKTLKQAEKRILLYQMLIKKIKEKGETRR